MITKLLIVGNVIHNASSFIIETAKELECEDITYPKHTIPGYEIVSADVPVGFTAAAYTYENGQVIAKPIPNTYAADSVVRLNEVRVLRERILARLNGYGTTLLLREPPEIEEEKSNCTMLIQGLLDITTISSVVDAKTLTELDIAIKTEWYRLVSLATPGLKKAFNQIDI